MTISTFKKKDFTYLFMRDREREAETQAKGEEGSLQGARCGIDPGIPRSCPWPKAAAQPLSHPGILTISTFIGLAKHLAIFKYHAKHFT